VATFVLVPGAGSDSWYWHLVEPELRAAGHETIAVDLPCTDDAAGIPEYADAVVTAIGEGAARDDLVLVAQSMGGFSVPFVCARVPVRLVVLVAAMTPHEGESPGEWWGNTGQSEALREKAAREGYDAGDVPTLFVHDVPPDVAAASVAHQYEQSGTPFERPLPMPPWPDVPTRFLLCRDDRFFPADFQRRVVRERLGIVPDEMDGGHLPALARPRELARRLLAYWADCSAVSR
jgi:hypothetical protein